MINTFYFTDTLDSAPAFLASFLIGLAFGFVLERAGFGSSRRISGVFYFEDMAVIKVMGTALVTAMLGLAYAAAFGWIGPETIFLMPTLYGAHIAGGLIFGVGFAMAGWCPGTSAVGAASGKLDALVFLIGLIGGSIVFNEVYPRLGPVYEWHSRGIEFVYDSLKLGKTMFSFLFTVAAIICFWLAETIEKRRERPGALLDTPFFKSFALALIVLAGGLFLAPGPSSTPTTAAGPGFQTTPTAPQAFRTPAAGEAALMADVEGAADHIEPEELADRMMAGEPGLVVVDVRPETEYRAFHIRGSVNVPISELAGFLAPYQNKGIIVLYSNGMTHPAQARDSLARLGYQNVYILTDGLKGFMESCLKPVSLRTEPVTEETAARILAWRTYFYDRTAAEPELPERAQLPSVELPGIVPADWLQDNLNKDGLLLIDLRGQNDYNGGHIPGSIRLDIESVRGVVGGVPSVLQPAPILVAIFSEMGLGPEDLVVLVTNGQPRDATLVGMALERLGHTRYALLDTSVLKWAADNRPMDTVLPTLVPSQYPLRPGADNFTVGYETVLAEAENKQTVILDVRPLEYFTGQKSDEARAGHIPGAINRPYGEDLVTIGEETTLKPIAELAEAYSRIIPSKDTPIIVHCRTGHQASQTFFVLKRLLGYKNVRWYDAGWTEWAARPELPVVTGQE